MKLNTSVFRAASAVFLAGGTLALAAPAHAQIVTNGDFETYDGLTVPSWTVSGNANMGTANDVYLFGAPHSGDFAAWLATPNSNGFLSQTLATTIGQTYTLTYWLAVDTSNQLSDITNKPAFEPAIVNDFTTLFNGQTVFTQNNLAPTDGHLDFADDYTKFTYTTVATSTATPLQFGFRNDNSQFRLDDVSVTSSAAPVPESSTLFSLAVLLSLTGAVVAARRRRASQA